jgi:hypothetical protein
MNSQTSRSSDFLRIALLVDAIATGATALAMAALAGPLAGWLNLPAPLLFWAGVALVPWVAFVAALSRRARIPARDVRAVVVGNALWAVSCVALALVGGPSALGIAFLLAQALVVAAFAELQIVGLRRAPVVAS